MNTNSKLSKPALVGLVIVIGLIVAAGCSGAPLDAAFFAMLGIAAFVLIKT